MLWIEPRSSCAISEYQLHPQAPCGQVSNFHLPRLTPVDIFNHSLVVSISKLSIGHVLVTKGPASVWPWYGIHCFSFLLQGHWRGLRWSEMTRIMVETIVERMAVVLLLPRRVVVRALKSRPREIGPAGSEWEVDKSAPEGVAELVPYCK